MTPEPEVPTGCHKAARALRALRPSLPLSGRVGSHGPTAQLGKSRPGRLHSRQTQSPGHTSKAGREKPTTPSLAARQLGKGSRPVYEQLAPLLLCATCHRGPRPPPSHPLQGHGGRGQTLVPGRCMASGKGSSAPGLSSPCVRGWPLPALQTPALLLSPGAASGSKKPRPGWPGSGRGPCPPVGDA